MAGWLQDPSEDDLQMQTGPQSAPAPFNPDVRDAIARKYGLAGDVAAAQEKANYAQFGDDLARAGAVVGAAISGPGVNVDDGFWSSKAARNQQSVKDLLARQEAADSDIERQERDKKIAQSDKLLDPNFALAKSARNKLRDVGFEVDESMSLTDMQQAGIDPFKLFSREKEKEFQKQLAQEARDDKYKFLRWKAELDAKARGMRAATAKPNPTQMKKQGLAVIGDTAESQYTAAVKRGKESGDYDPTDPTQFIDNSGWAPNWMKSDASIEARAAQDSWIDSYLRDESGAAIPADERDSYRKIYFPQPGDTLQAVQNKAGLREQKRLNALGAAGAGMQPQPAAVAFPMQVKNPKTGQVATVSDAAELEEARAEGFSE